MGLPTSSWRIVILIALIGGCLGGKPTPLAAPPAPEVSADWAKLALPAEADHLHNRSEQHRGLSTPNFELVGWSPVARDGGSTMGGGGCGAAVSTPGRQLAVFTSAWGDAQGLAVADVTNPAKPQKVGEIVSSQFWFRDAEITNDGKWAVVASFPIRPAPPLQAEPATYSNGCADALPPAAMSYQGGVALVDLSNPAQPRLVDFAPDYASGPHSVYATTVEGVHYVISAHNGAPSALSRFWFYTIQNGQLMPYGLHTVQVPDNPNRFPVANLHTDAWIQKHPKTGQLLAYIANWDSGFVVLRMDGPGRLVPLATWNNFDTTKGSEMTGQIHSVEAAPDLWGGKHYTFIGQEIIARPANRPTGQVIMLDTTDPTKPTPVARWTLPADTGTWDKTYTWCCLFSTHYLQLVDQTLFVAMYHGGVWAIDARPEAGPELPSLGAFIPSPPDTTYQSPTPLSPAPFVEEIWALGTGELVSFDEHGGLYTFRFHPEIKIPVPTPWTADAWIL